MAKRVARIKARAAKMDPYSDEFFTEAIEYSWYRPEPHDLDAPELQEALDYGLGVDTLSFKKPGSIAQRVLKSDSDIEEAESYGDWSTMLNHAERMMMDARGYITKGAQGHRQSDPLVDNDPRQL